MRAHWPNGLSCEYRCSKNFEYLIRDYINEQMSRSKKKIPIFGIAGAPSEKQDKRTWHKRWRAQQRTKQDSLANSSLEDHLPVVALDVSNVWSMAKDGRFYWAKSDHQSFANKLASRKATNPVEHKSLVKRNLSKIISK